MITVITNGSHGVGENTFVELCIRIINKVNYERRQRYNNEEDIKHIFYDAEKISYEDVIKHAARILGWDGTRGEKERKFLSDLEKIVNGYNDGCFKYIKSRNTAARAAESLKYRYIQFIHIEDINEIESLKRELSSTTNKVYTLLIKRSLVDSSDSDVENYDYDYVINNDGNINNLEFKAFNLLKTLNVNLIFDGYSDYKNACKDHIDEGLTCVR